MRRASVLACLVLLLGLVAVAAAGCGGGEEASPTAETVEGGGGETTATTEETGGEGDAEAGKAIFDEQGCGGCHTLAAAGSSGTVGPNLDDSKPAFDLVVERVTNGSGVMPSFKDKLSEQQIKDVAAYVSENAGK